VFLEKVVVDAWLVIETLEESRGHELEKIAVTLGVLTQQKKMVRTAHAGLTDIAALWRGAWGWRGLSTIVAAPAGDIDFATDDGLDPVCGGLVIEIRSGEEVSVIGNGHRGHAPPGGFRDELGSFTSAVKETVVGMQMKVNEPRLAHARTF
jgi:hypothetical protein